MKQIFLLLLICNFIDATNAQWIKLDKPNNNNYLHISFPDAENGWIGDIAVTDYKLRPLSEVAAFVAKHQHLPDMPSAKELEQNDGLAVSEMLTKQQQKIEELTLYIIEQNKQLEKLKARLDLTEAKILK